MEAPIFSTITLISEIFVTMGVLYVYYFAFYKNTFKPLYAFAVLAYEIFVNVAYMVYRVLTHTETGKYQVWEVVLLALHGTLSLIMLIALIVLFVKAYLEHKKGKNFLAKHKLISLSILGVWLFSVASGCAVYFVEYILGV